MGDSNILKKATIIILLIIMANLTLIVFLSEKDDMDNTNTGNITLVEKKRDFTKTVTIYIMVKGGIFAENEINNGIGSLFSRVWIKSNKILETAEFYGGSINSKISPYALEISLSIPTEYVDKVYNDFAELLTAPIFNEEVFKREQAIYLDELRANKDNPNAQAYNGFNKLAYAGSPYALSIEGTEESIKKLTLNDLKSYYKDNMKSSYMVVSIAGNYENSLIDRLKADTAKLEKGMPYVYNCNNAGVDTARRKEDTDSRIQQAKLFIGYEAPDATSSDYVALKVLTDILGGGMSSRYFLEIRKNSGYAYAVSAAYPSRYCSSRFIVSAGLDYENVESAIKKVDDINLNLKDTLTDKEIEKAKKSIAGSVLMETQSNASLAWNRAFFETMGLGADYYETYVDRLQHIDRDAILKAAEIFKKPKVIYVLKPEIQK